MTDEEFEILLKKYPQLSRNHGVNVLSLILDGATRVVMTDYTIDYFINKFEAIPKERWCTASLTKDDRCCALGHCGVYNDLDTEYWAIIDEAIALNRLLTPILIKKHSNFILKEPYTAIWMINDDIFNNYIKGCGPKDRILNALKSLKD